jgi:hypothetical protein
MGCSFITPSEPCNNKRPRCDIAWPHITNHLYHGCLTFNSENVIEILHITFTHVLQIWKCFIIPNIIYFLFVLFVKLTHPAYMQHASWLFIAVINIRQTSEKQSTYNWVVLMAILPTDIRIFFTNYDIIEYFLNLAYLILFIFCLFFLWNWHILQWNYFDNIFILTLVY